MTAPRTRARRAKHYRTQMYKRKKQHKEVYSTKMSTNTHRLKFYSDPGHGWLRAPRTLLKKLEIEDQISSYSYQFNNWVYLEEDRDMAVFQKGIHDAGQRIIVTYHDAKGSSTIRTFERYTP